MIFRRELRSDNSNGIKMRGVGLGGASIFFFYSMLSVSSSGLTATPGDLKIVVDNDKKMCSSLKNAMDKFKIEHDTALFFEEDLDGLYRGTNFRIPKRINKKESIISEYDGNIFPDDSDYDIRGMSGYIPSSGIDQFYYVDVYGSGENNLIYMRYKPHGESYYFHTDVWVFEVGAKFSPLNKEGKRRGRYNPQFLESDIALHIDHDSVMGLFGGRNGQGKSKPSVIFGGKSVDDEEKEAAYAALNTASHIVYYGSAVYFVASFGVGKESVAYHLLRKNTIGVDCILHP